MLPAGRCCRSPGSGQGGEASAEKQERGDTRRLAGMAEIIREIQKMAIETNTPALNAAVEAAHLAEAGLGFERTAAPISASVVQCVRDGVKVTTGGGRREPAETRLKTRTKCRDRGWLSHKKPDFSHGRPADVLFNPAVGVITVTVARGCPSRCVSAGE
jgi:hypothetical protein